MQLSLMSLSVILSQILFVSYQQLYVEGNTSIFPFRNVSLPWKLRVDDLVSRLSLSEIRDQLSHGGVNHHGPAPSIARLAINPYSWNTECLRGDVEAGKATSFPEALGLAAAFNSDIIFEVAKATGEEVRAKYNNYTHHDSYGDHKGLSCFSPVINIMRHPYWGRSQETYGEDPFLSGIYAANFVQGLQGSNSRYIQASAGCKHFDAFSGPGNNIGGDVRLSERDWRTTFLPAFKRCVKAGTFSLMCSYNSIHGVPSCTNLKLLTTILRDEWNFTGYVVSDEGALQFAISDHRYYNNYVDAAAGSLNAGCNLELSVDRGPGLHTIYYNLLEAVIKNKTSEKMMRERVKPLFYTRMRLGEFDPPEMNPYTKLNLSVVQSPIHQNLSLVAAMQSFVLLKNNGFLPLADLVYESIAVVGPMANSVEQLYGDYSPTPEKSLTITILKGLSSLGKHVQYSAGCDGNLCKHYDSSGIRKAVGDVDVVFVCLGTGTDMETEGRDRSTMDLPVNQTALLHDVIKYGSATPIVLLLFNAGPVNLTDLMVNNHIVAIIECFYPAQFAGEAVKRVLLNSDRYSNPAGRLPYTWLAYQSQIYPITDYKMSGKTYRYFTGVPLFPFGYGLSYSKFQYSHLECDAIISAGENFHLSVAVSNVGPYPGDEVVQVYISWDLPPVQSPQRQLVGFRRVHLPIGEQIVEFIVEAEDMALWYDDKGFVIAEGPMTVYVGGQQPNQNRSLSSNVLRAMWFVQGSSTLS